MRSRPPHPGPPTRSSSRPTRAPRSTTTSPRRCARWPPRPGPPTGPASPRTSTPRSRTRRPRTPPGPAGRTGRRTPGVHHEQLQRHRLLDRLLGDRSATGPERRCRYHAGVRGREHGVRDLQQDRLDDRRRDQRQLAVVRLRRLLPVRQRRWRDRRPRPHPQPLDRAAVRERVVGFRPLLRVRRGLHVRRRDRHLQPVLLPVHQLPELPEAVDVARHVLHHVQHVHPGRRVHRRRDLRDGPGQDADRRRRVAAVLHDVLHLRRDPRRGPRRLDAAAVR